jgi:hypothetical protein
MIENTLVVFTTWAACFGIRFYFATSVKSVVVNLAAFVLLVTAGMFTKGPVGLFPLAVPFFCYLIAEHWRSAAIKHFAISALPVASVFVAFALLWQCVEVRKFFTDFFIGQIVPSALSKRESSGSHFSIILSLLESAAVPVAIVAATWAFFKTMPRWALFRSNKLAIFALLTFASAALPFLVSTKQMPWYLIPSYPFLAIFLAEISANSFAQLQNILLARRGVLAGVLAAVLATALMLVFLTCGKVYKNPSFYNSFLPVQNILPQRTSYGVCDEKLLVSWYLVTPLFRYFQASVIHNSSESGIWIVERESTICFDASACNLLNNRDLFFNVYSCKK